MDHQDWKIRYVHKKNPPPTKPTKPTKPQNHTKTEKLDVDNNPKAKKKMDGVTASLITRKRIAMGYASQKAFAAKLSFPLIDIRNCETPNAIYKPRVLSKIKRVLGINKDNMK